MKEEKKALLEKGEELYQSGTKFAITLGEWAEMVLEIDDVMEIYKNDLDFKKLDNKLKKLDKRLNKYM